MRFLALTCAFLFALAGSAAAAPTADFTFSPPTPTAGQTVTFNPAITADLDPVVADWDFENDGTLDQAGVDPNTNVTHVFPSPGTYQVRMVARETLPGVEQTTVIKPVTVVAPNAAPVAQFSFNPAAPVVGQEVIFESFSYDSDGSIAGAEWDLNYDGARFDVDATGNRPTTKFATAGTRTIGLRVRDDDGAVSPVATKTVTVGPAPANPLPVAQFDFSPTAPLVGQQVSLKSFSYDPGGSIVSQRWDLDGDLDFDENVNGPTAFTVFTTPGTKTVRLEVRGSDGQTQTATQTIKVGGPIRRAVRASLMYPFPVVRLAGSVLAGGARVRTLEVRAPRRSSITVRCQGKSCPTKQIVKRSKKRLVRFKRMARFLAARTVITVSVRKGKLIGKHTRWLIRAGKLPKRSDACLYPGKRKPARCPRS